MSASGDDRIAKDQNEIDQLLQELLSTAELAVDKPGFQHEEPSLQQEGLPVEHQEPVAEREEAPVEHQDPVIEHEDPAVEHQDNPFVRAIAVAPDEPRPAKPVQAELVQAEVARAPQPRGRRGGFPLLAGAIGGLVVIAGLAGYWFGFQRAEDGAESTVVAAPEPAAGATEPLAEQDPEPVATSAPVDSTSTPDSAAAVEALTAQLETLDLSLISFSPGTERLTDDGAAVLADVAAAVIAHPSIPVSLQVSTFSEEDLGDNHGLSLFQAEAIYRAMVAEGVEPMRLVSVGFGGVGSGQVPGSSLLRFETEDPDLAAELTRIDGTAVSLAPGATLAAEARANLDAVTEALASHPDAAVALIGYAYADSDEASHDQSHDLAAEASAYFEGRGIAGDRLSTVGMGDAPIEIDRKTEVKIDVGPPAAMSLALSQLRNELIRFEPGTDTIAAQSLAVLSDVAAAMALDPTSRVEISAHTYSEATSEQNHDLSHRQGDAVAAALVDAGVAGERLSVVGNGDPEHLAVVGRDNYVTFTRLGS